MAFFKAATAPCEAKELHNQTKADPADQPEPGFVRENAGGPAGKAYRTVELLVKLGLDPDPKSFAVFYSYESQDNPRITSVVDEQLASGEPFTNFLVEQIYAENLGPESDAQSLKEISNGLNSHVESVRSLINQGIEHGDSHSREVIGITDNLNGSEDHQSLLDCAEEIRSSNRNLVANMKQLNRGLSEAQRNVEQLKT